MYILFLLTTLATASGVNVSRIWDFVGNIINLTDAVATAYIPEDAQHNISVLVHKYGYKLQEQYVITQDDYMINFHRIWRDDVKRNGRVVFLMHGIWESSDSWVIQGPNKALAYVLADQGYDVWMGNARGNKYSLGHRTMPTNSSNFWEFTWEEIGLYDLAAMIDHALLVTGNDNLYYIGHSQGTTSCYVLLSMKPEYNGKIKMMFSLAPEAWMGNVKSPLVRMLSPYSTLGQWLQSYEIFSPSTVLFNKISALLCTVLPIRCDNILYAITGHGNKINETLLPVIFGHMPTGASTLQFLHYGQLVMSKRFCRYDYGEERNIERYGQKSPPDYDLSKISVPVVIYYSGNDWLSDPRDVEILKKHLPNVYASVYLGDFSHMDYVYSYEAVDSIYSRIKAEIEKFEKNDDRDINRVGFNFNVTWS